MSHVVSIKTQVKDAAALSAACRRLKLAEPSSSSPSRNPVSVRTPRLRVAASRLLKRMPQNGVACGARRGERARGAQASASSSPSPRWP